MFGINKGALQPGALGAGNDRQAVAECNVEAERAGRNTFDGHAVVVAQAHDGALAERFLDGGDGVLQGLGTTFLRTGRVLRCASA